MRVGRIDRKSHFSVALITCYFGLRRFVYTRRIDLLRPCRADVPLTSRKASAGAFCMWRGSRRWLPLGRALESASTGTPPEEAIRPWARRHEVAHSFAALCGSDRWGRCGCCDRLRLAPPRWYLRLVPRALSGSGGTRARPGPGQVPTGIFVDRRSDERWRRQVPAQGLQTR